LKSRTKYEYARVLVAAETGSATSRCLNYEDEAWSILLSVPTGREEFPLSRMSFIQGAFGLTPGFALSDTTHDQAR
jgi:hypothetical protein